MQSFVKKQLTHQCFQNLDRVLTGSRESLDVGSWAGEVAEPLGDGEAVGGRGGFWWMLLLLGGELGFPAGVCHSSSGERGLRNVGYFCFSLPNLWYKAFYNIYYSFDKIRPDAESLRPFWFPLFVFHFGIGNTIAGNTRT